VECPVCNTPRSRNAAATRQAMLTAARRRFLEESYENVGLRDIAGDVGVDATLVNRYFGSKEQLFKEVLLEGKSDKLAGADDDLAGYLACLVANRDGSEDPHATEKLLIILRSASSPQASAIVARTVREDMLEPLAGLIDGDNAEARASLGLSVMIGTTVLRSILGVTAMSECDHEALRARLAEMFRVALCPDLGPCTGSTPDAR